MIIKINGSEISVKEGMSLNTVIEERRLDPSAIVVELNTKIVSRQELGSVLLKENDSVEIVSFVGGG